MADWLTYSASDFLLFAPRTYYRLFELYNEAIWPGQFLALAAGIVIFALLLRRDAKRSRAVPALLAACWLWVAWAYLLTRYDTINWAAKYFAIGFVLQAVLLIAVSLRRRVHLSPSSDTRNRFGLALFIFALAIQPLIGPLLFDRPWTETEIFALAPDPTAVATLGALLLSVRGRAALLLMPLPLVWCAVSAVTLWTMGSPEAWVMTIVPAAALACIALFPR
ncbi:MAG: DUF6064 family protein [Alphaproteobacteria bacterium]|nr:DUF6064 family protein [Alphaproteobacteria bacterium]